MSQSLPPTVCLNGALVRRVREEKKLTQLYVAKVVGVTTDTISRWENNRYPSIKRENALRLAEALEVSVEQILEGGTGECPLPEAPPSTGSRWYRIVPPILVLAVLAGMFLYFHRGEVLEAGVTGSRLLPAYAAPGSIIPVQIRLEADSEMKGIILREHFPRGWKLIEASPPASSLDNVEGVARWIIKPNEGQRPISYLLKVGEKAELGSSAAFSGEVVAKSNGRTPPAPVLGEMQIKVAPFLWADLNGDNLIDDGEMLQASDTVDEMKGVHINWELLENIWDAGSYKWDVRKQGFVPVKPPPPDPAL
jgi:transcriptional regulator with XRE-family HTH domain